MGHRLKVPDKLLGKKIDCPSCGTPFRVTDESAPPQPKGTRNAASRPTKSPKPAKTQTLAVEQPNVQLSRGQVNMFLGGWAGSLLIAVLLGAFVSRSMGPPIIVEARTAPVLASAEQSDTSFPVPNFVPQTPDHNESPGNRNNDAIATATAVPEAGSGVRPSPASVPVVSRETERARSNARRIAEVQAAVPKPPAEVKLTQTEAAETVKADLREAVSMIKKRQFQMLLHDFMSAEIQANVTRSSSRNRSTKFQLMKDEEATELAVNLEAAISGEMAFNRNNTLVEIHFVRTPKMTVPPSPPSYLPAMDDRPLRPASGLGSNLQTMLGAAANLLKENKTEEFILHVYPLAEVARLAEADFRSLLVKRVESRPEMRDAMIRDLEQASKATPSIGGANATVKLPPLVAGDRERELRFQLVEGNWRFFDGNADTRAEFRRLVQGKIPAVTIPGAKGVLLLVRYGENWRMTAPPTTEPLL